MKKSVKKLNLHRETVVRLDLAAGGASGADVSATSADMPCSAIHTVC